MKRNLILTASILGVLSLASCKNEEKKQKNSEVEKTEKMQTKKTEQKEDTANKKLALSSEKQYESVRLYLDLKDALVKSDSYSAKKIAEILVIKNQSAAITKTAKEIVENEENIEAQRKAFFKLSEYMEELVSENIKAGTLYKQYCPMAFEGEGGFWLSEDKEIMNPYFGDKMLHCGSIKETIK